MSSVTVQCPDCSLKLADVEHPDVDYKRDGNGNIVCPNDGASMLPIGESTVINAEEAFAQANRELAGDVKPMPPAETTETLMKRLEEIESSRTRVMMLQSAHLSAKERAKDAKSEYDDAVVSFLSLVGRMVRVNDLPLFSAEAEAAAQPTDSAEPAAGEPADSGDEAVAAAAIEAEHPAAEEVQAASEPEAAPEKVRYPRRHKKATEPVEAHV